MERFLLARNWVYLSALKMISTPAITDNSVGVRTLYTRGVAALKAALAKAGYDKYSAYDLAWQSLHMAAAAACRGSTPSGGTGCCGNSVLVRDTTEQKTCRQICAQSGQPNCDAELSIYGYPGKAKQNGQLVGSFYKYGCYYAQWAGKEATGAEEDVMNPPNTYFGFCCCRK